VRRERELAERLATVLLQRASVRQTTPPCDVESVAYALGIRIARRSMPQAGRLVAGEAGWTIEVSADEHVVRQRFTIAHELTHWLLQNPGADTSLTTELADAWRSEERMCDTVAGAVLLPRDWLLAHFPFAQRAEQHSLATIDHVARIAQISLAATLVRLRDVLGWRHTLLHWTWEAGRWLFDGEAGVTVAQLGMVCPTEETDWTLSTARGRGPIYQRLYIPLLIENREMDISAELLVRSGSAVALVRLPYKQNGKIESDRIVV